MQPPARYGTQWTSEDVALLRKLAKENTPTRICALKLKRTEQAVYSKASELGLSLDPPNQSPYGLMKRGPLMADPKPRKR